MFNKELIIINTHIFACQSLLEAFYVVNPDEYEPIKLGFTKEVVSQDSKLPLIDILLLDDDCVLTELSAFDEELKACGRIYLALHKGNPQKYSISRYMLKRYSKQIYPYIPEVHTNQGALFDLIKSLSETLVFEEGRNAYDRALNSIHDFFKAYDISLEARMEVFHQCMSLSGMEELQTGNNPRRELMKEIDSVLEAPEVSAVLTELEEGGFPPSPEKTEELRKALFKNSYLIKS